MSKICQRRLQKEYIKLLKQPINNILACPSEKSILK